MIPRDFQNIHIRNSCRDTLLCGTKNKNYPNVFPCWWKRLLVATSKFGFLTTRWHNATRKHLFLYPKRDRSGLRKLKKASTSINKIFITQNSYSFNSYPINLPWCQVCLWNVFAIFAIIDQFFVLINFHVFAVYCTAEEYINFLLSCRSSYAKVLFFSALFIWHFVKKSSSLSDFICLTLITMFI